MFPTYDNMPTIGFWAVLASVVGFGWVQWPGALVGFLLVLAFFILLEFRRARQREREIFQAHVDEMRDRQELTKLLED